MTTIERFEEIYRSASDAVKQRFDDILTGVTIANGDKHGPVSDHPQSDTSVPRDRETVKGDPQ
ncbi:MAG: hypothetical protein IKE64_14940 [Thermoguttaceae bacterium]|nr:hypothetical protein [Thermoguttaceae bacterium]